MPINEGCVHIFEGAANNLPDPDSVNTTEKIINMVHNLTEADLVIALVSGGKVVIPWKWLCRLKPLGNMVSD